MVDDFHSHDWSRTMNAIDNSTDANISGLANMETKPPLKVDVVSDVICPWCYIGKRRLERAIEIVEAEGISVEVTWRAFELNPDMPIKGMNRKAYRSAKFGSWDKSKSMDDHVVEEGRGEGLEFAYDRVELTPNTRRAHRLARRALREGGISLQNAVVDQLFLAYFNVGDDVGDIDTLARIGTNAGMNGNGLVEYLRSDEDDADVLGEEELGQRAGLSGVPSVLRGDLFLYSGAQPAEHVAKILRNLSERRSEEHQAQSKGSTVSKVRPEPDKFDGLGPSLFT